MKAYHYTHKDHMKSIMENGLVPSSGEGENLPFVMLTTEKYSPQPQPEMANRVYLEVELDETDERFRMVNDSWIEFVGIIEPERIKAIARDWTNAQAIEWMKKNGSAEEFISEFMAYKPL